MAWYNTYRPKTFEDVMGQDLVKSVLQNALSKGKIKHAYLFSGPKGVGKTTLARIFANQLNQTDQNPEASLDIVEMDAASHTGVDDVRQLIESAKTQPIAGQYKIFIIDEVHMLSKSAMNALLKILEEPPVYLIFLLATTNAEKLLPTVMSRLTKLNLFNHTTDDIVAKLDQIASIEGLSINPKALQLIAKHSGGSQRDAINLLETVASYGLDNYDENNTGELLGLLPQELLKQVADRLISTGIDLELVKKIEAKGLDGQGFLAQLLEYLLDLSMNGQKDYESLILPTAETLDLELPLTTPLSSLALVQVKLNQVDQAPVKKKPEAVTQITKPTDPKPEQPAQPTPEAQPPENPHAFSKPPTSHQDIPAPFQANPTPDPAQDTTALEESKNSTESTSPTSNEQPTNIADFVFKLPNLPQAPAVLKMLAKDLSGEMRDNKLVLFNSNPTFQAAVKSPKLQDWIKDQFNKNFGYTPTIVLEIRKDRPKPTQTSQQPETKSTLANDPNDSKIFYKVYRELPKNMEDKGVDVRQDPLPGPNDTEKDWDDHARELFEFE